MSRFGDSNTFPTLWLRHVIGRHSPQKTAFPSDETPCLWTAGSVLKFSSTDSADSYNPSMTH
ncbi:MAG: hypothetical protein J4O05_11145, partial [Chloroflexi bacterium]|nr:hypothetical protein [Chloroflexota bacterium]